MYTPKFHPAFIIISLLIGLALSANAQVNRGPYLQMLGEEEITVRWRTDLFAESIVYYGPSPYALAFIATEPGTHLDHQVTLDGLEAGKRYYYAIANAAGYLTTPGPAIYFETAPPRDTRKPFRIWAIGDSGTGNSDARAVRDAYYGFDAQHTDVWLMLGDNAYLDGTDLQYQNAVFANMYEELMVQTPISPCPGNHDLRAYLGDGADAPYFDIFNLPTAGELGGLSSGVEHYYSFDYANVHFVMLDSEKSGRNPGDPMLEWLRADLAANESDWTIVAFHHPVYSKGSHDSDVSLKQIEMRSNVLPLLDSAGVDLVLSGHSHSYERSYLLRGHYGVSSTFNSAMQVNAGDGQPSGDGVYMKSIAGADKGYGIVYVTIGSSGSLEMMGGLDHPANFAGTFTLGSVVIDVDGLDMLVQFIDDGGNVQDHFVLSKNDISALPEISLLPPANLSAISSTTFAALATDPDGTVSEVIFRVDGNIVGTDSLAPFAVNWLPSSAGFYRLDAVVVDNDGNRAYSEMRTFRVGRRARGRDFPDMN